MAKRKSPKKKRTITPEHLAKMQAGRAKAQKHKERVESVSDLDARLRKNGSRT